MLKLEQPGLRDAQPGEAGEDGGGAGHGLQSPGLQSLQGCSPHWHLPLQIWISGVRGLSIIRRIYNSFLERIWEKYSRGNPVEYKVTSRVSQIRWILYTCLRKVASRQVDFGVSTD